MVSRVSEQSEVESIERLEQDLALLIRTLESLYRRRHYPLDRAHYLLLNALQDGAQRSGELASVLGLDHSTVTRQIAAMESRDLVTKRDDPQDKRSSLVEATELGQQRCTEMRELRLRRLKMLLNEWDGADLSILADMISRLNLDLKSYLKK